MAKKKLQRFEENKTFYNLFQPEYEEVEKVFFLKGNWNRNFFNNQNPIVIELGCGKGEYSIGLARKFAGKNFIGIDRKGARIWRGCKTSVEESLINVAFLRIRVELLEKVFDRQEVSEIWITFPDPHPKSKESKRRLTSPRFLKIYQNILAPGGIIHLKTDNGDLFDYTLEVIREFNYNLHYQTKDLYKSAFGGEAPKIQTFYERMFLDENTQIKYLLFSFDKSSKFKKDRAEVKSQKNNESFFEQVYSVVKLVPRGRVTSYGAIASYLGSAGSARMVGWAMNASHSHPEDIPAHRVVNRIGVLTGKHHFGSPLMMQQLLENEGIRVVDDQIIDFEQYFWDPLKELLSV
ncbi:MAG: tRNA (guanosine(46)-N7)-methyltransferase TrmB [Bacteroidales bacterium]|nr:tRNA (guanosine(46)-N7)-methyltransferase TrmB [Bacteroidales bacterium]